MKKNFVFAVALCFFIPTVSNAMTTECFVQSENSVCVEITSQSSQDRSVVFRSTQRLRSSDGRSIYLYPNRKCELFDGDRLEVVCTYTIYGNEVRLLDEYGNTVYKGTFTYTSDRRNIGRLTMAGTTYTKF